jgi:hypothetical protein
MAVLLHQAPHLGADRIAADLGSTYLGKAYLSRSRVMPSRYGRSRMRQLPGCEPTAIGWSRCQVPGARCQVPVAGSGVLGVRGAECWGSAEWAAAAHPPDPPVVQASRSDLRPSWEDSGLGAERELVFRAWPGCESCRLGHGSAGGSADSRLRAGDLVRSPPAAKHDLHIDSVPTSSASSTAAGSDPQYRRWRCSRVRAWEGVPPAHSTGRSRNRCSGRTAHSPACLSRYR